MEASPSTVVSLSGREPSSLAFGAGQVYHRDVSQRRHHYEQAFESYLRDRRVPYVSVHDARKVLLPEPSGERMTNSGAMSDATLKSFDFVIYGDARNLLVEVKGRKIVRPAARRDQPHRPATTRLQCWVTQDDVTSLQRWEGLFGPGFEAVFVFMYWCDDLPPRPLFEDIYEFRDRWYAVRVVDVSSYAAAMRPRSARWKTVHLPTAVFDRISGPLIGWDGGEPEADTAVEVHPGRALQTHPEAV